MNTAEKIAVMQGYLDGKKIQFHHNHGVWSDFQPGSFEPVWNWECT